MSRKKIREIIYEKFGTGARLCVNSRYDVRSGKYYKYSIEWTCTNQSFIFANTLKGLYEIIEEMY